MAKTYGNLGGKLLPDGGAELYVDVACNGGRFGVMVTVPKEAVVALAARAVGNESLRSQEMNGLIVAKVMDRPKKPQPVFVQLPGPPGCPLYKFVWNRAWDGYAPEGRARLLSGGRRGIEFRGHMLVAPAAHFPDAESATRWAEEHGGEVPLTPDERRAFRLCNQSEGVPA